MDRMNSCVQIVFKSGRIVIGVLYLVSAIGSSLAWGPISFAIFRFIGGLGVGASSVAAPTYISEIAPTKHRGRLVALYQFLIVLGILVDIFFYYYFIQSEFTWGCEGKAFGWCCR